MPVSTPPVILPALSEQPVNAALAAPPVAAPPATISATNPETAIDDEGGSICRDFLYSSPTWGISMLLHILLVLALALYTTAEAFKPGSTILTASLNDAPEELAEQLDDVIKLEEVEVNPMAVDNPHPAQTSIDASETVMTPEKLDGEATSDLPELSDFGDPANGLLAEIGAGIGDKPGAGNSATFFGVPAKGKKFCFVVDNSRSMRGAKFENALYELGMAIDKLKPDQSFYIIFFSDQPYPLFYPQAAESFVPATPQNKQRLVKWLPTVELHLKTKGSEAMKLALDLSPDAIYVLGDGAFTDNTVKEVLAREYNRTKIHTIGFNMKEGSRQAKDFEDIAKKFYGTYREVSEKPVK